MSIGPGKLSVRPGEPEPWVAGRVRGDDERATPRIETDGGTATLTQRGGSFRLSRGITPSLELALGSAHPYELAIEGGANDIACDLGGLPLEAFSGEFGAGRIRIDASSPNPVEMARFSIQTGATDLALSNLANFNAASVEIEGGAASMKIDFGGSLQRSCHARISTGVASLTISIPRSLAARVNAKTTLGSLSIGDGFMTRSGGYWTEAAVVGEGPLLTIEANSSLGSLKVLISD